MYAPKNTPPKLRSLTLGETLPLADDQRNLHGLSETRHSKRIIAVQLAQDRRNKPRAGVLSCSGSYGSTSHRHPSHWLVLAFFLTAFLTVFFATGLATLGATGCFFVCVRVEFLVFETVPVLLEAAFAPAE